MKKVLTKEFKIGLSVIAAIIILVVGIDFLKGINLFKPTNYYVVEYDNVAGLEPAAAVTIDGYKVGQVREINFNYEHPGKVEVVLALDEDLHLPVDTRAELGSALMGGSFVKLIMGQSKTVLPVGGVIKGVASKDLMSSLSSELVPQVGSTIAHIDTLVNSLNRIVSDPALYQSVQRLDGITANLLTTTTNLDAMMSKDMPGIVRNAKGVIVKVDTIAYNMAVLSKELKELPLRPTLDNINQLVSNLEAFSKQLNDKKSSLGKFTNDPELYDRLNTTIADVDTLVKDIKQNPKRYINIKVF